MPLTDVLPLAPSLQLPTMLPFGSNHSEIVEQLPAEIAGGVAPNPSIYISFKDREQNKKLAKMYLYPLNFFYVCTTEPKSLSEIATL